MDRFSCRSGVGVVFGSLSLFAPRSSFLPPLCQLSPLFILSRLQLAFLLSSRSTPLKL